jgi:hypothetical protein
MDALTQSAFELLRRLAVESPDRKYRRAIEVIQLALGGSVGRPPEMTRCQIVTSAARREEDEVNDDETDDPIDDGPIDDLTTAALESAIAAGAKKNLTTCPSADPLPAQQRIAEAAIDEAKRAGLRLPPFTIDWRLAIEGVSNGAAMRDGETFTLFLSVAQAPETLRETTLHEAMHLHDYFSGETFSRIEQERRAIKFAAQCCGEG